MARVRRHVRRPAGAEEGCVNHDAHVHAYQNECLRRCLIRQLLRWRAERGDDWMRGFVADWKRWPGLREDFKRQWAAGGRGAEGDWR